MPRSGCGSDRYLADSSALARLHLPAVREGLEPLITRALVGICGVTELEMLFSARDIQERSRSDRDFDTIARFTEQPVRWIVPPGTV